MIKLKNLIFEIIDKVEVPAEPGTVHIPPNHLRLYHYTYAPPDVIKKEGLKLSHAKGNTYGEPNVIWASLQLPNDNKTFVEFSMAIDDPRFTSMGAKPDVTSGVNFYKGRHNDFTILGDIKPSEFIAVHEPWHHTYRYLVDNGLIKKVLNGEYDYLLGDDKHPNEARAISAIKHNFSTHENGNLKELEYPMAKKDDLQSYQGEEGWKGKIVWMPPSKFLRLVYPLPKREESDESSQNIERRMKSGLPIDFLVLVVDMKNKKVTGHEGRHRATVAKKLGVEKVPVLIYTGGAFERVPKWTPDIHATIDAADFKPEYDKT